MWSWRTPPLLVGQTAWWFLSLPTISECWRIFNMSSCVCSMRIISKDMSCMSLSVSYLTFQPTRITLQVVVHRYGMDTEQGLEDSEAQDKLSILSDTDSQTLVIYPTQVISNFHWLWMAATFPQGTATLHPSLMTPSLLWTSQLYFLSLHWGSGVHNSILSARCVRQLKSTLGNIRVGKEH